MTEFPPAAAATDLPPIGATEPPVDDGRSPWRLATVSEVLRQSPRIVMLRLEVPDRIPQLAGQHYVVRLTAPDGYTAQRSYSVASSPADPLVELGIDVLEDGEVSGYLGEVVQPGDTLEVRGPIGGWFVWTGDTPAVAIGGGSGVVPLLAMLRHARDIAHPELFQLAVSARTPADLLYRDELTAGGALIAYTRSGPTTGGSRRPGRLTGDDLLPLISPGATYFVCGSAAFAEAISRELVDLGVPPADIRVERFGPSA
jgi:ferredoxin-NADP reductase